MVPFYENIYVGAVPIKGTYLSNYIDTKPIYVKVQVPLYVQIQERNLFMVSINVKKQVPHDIYSTHIIICFINIYISQQ